ncbi:DUF1351 domain-containing protein [Lactobacillus acidophilus]|uniref:DUF1351 domain-containing protein n=1 Tax=Lactobacillus acidophilus TaxID=1579 RepID=UPI0021A8746D|nr:DUF1351 domain-containing protein [Lactobacillus acidophilus]MCT3601561.1 DUF1351 domain-containing protein [Lactobacillus acidophilus]MCT3624260.1 DUF1351 domain-containing protein [Lactobacillus acidophilus]
MNNEIFKLNNNEYSLEYESAKLDFKEYPKLKAQVDELKNQFSEWEVTPENLGSSIETRKKLRKFSKAINSKKIAIVKVVNAPVKQFQIQIKDLCKEVDWTADQIDKQIKVFEDRARTDKHEQNLKRIAKIAKEAGLDEHEVLGYIEPIYDSRWDNKTYNFKAFQIDIKKLIDQYVALRKAKQEAYKLIVGKADDLRLMPKEFLASYDHGTELVQVLKDMEEERKYLDDLAQKQAETKKKEQAALLKRGDKGIDPKTGEVKDKFYTAVLETKKKKIELSGTKYQFKQLFSFLSDMGFKLKEL